MYFQKWFIPEQLLQLAEFALDSCFTGCGIDQTVFIAGFYITDFSYIKGIDIMRKRFRIRSVQQNHRFLLRNSEHTIAVAMATLRDSDVGAPLGQFGM